MYPTRCWYVAATGAEVTGSPLGRRALDRGLVLYRTQILETMQRVLDVDGPRNDVRVAADAAAVQVRKIVGRMPADDREGR